MTDTSISMPPSTPAQPPHPVSLGPVKEIVPGRSLWSDARRRLLKDRGAVICMIILLIYVLVALGGGVYDVLGKYWPDTYPPFSKMKDYSRLNQPPQWPWDADSWKNVLGTDWAGRGILVKALLGAKVSLTVGFMANIIAIPLGMMLGALAGFYSGKFLRGGVIDDVIVWLYSTLASIPSLVLLLAFKFVFKDKVLWPGTWAELDLGGIHGLYLALGVTSWIGTCRLVRAEVLKIRELEYVLAARATGRGSFSILLRHVMPNVLHLGIINFSLGFIGAVQAEVILSYLGLGVAVGTPSWGNMINSARMDLHTGRWWELSAAVTAMFFLVLALNILGDRLRDALDPRLKNVG